MFKFFLMLNINPVRFIGLAPQVLSCSATEQPSTWPPGTSEVPLPLKLLTVLLW